MLEKSEFNQNLLEFLNDSPTPYHAVANMRSLFDNAGFTALKEAEDWNLENDHTYYVERNQSSIIAFTLPAITPIANGFRMIGAHSDSPCLKLKPNPVLNNHGCVQLGVEVYGGVLLAPWFDRDLSIAGRVTYEGKDNIVTHALINFESPIAIIPSLAIHLDREVNKKRSINAQSDLPPLLLNIECDQNFNLNEVLLSQLKKQYPDRGADRVLDFELSLYDVQPSAFVGLKQEFITSARLDNLLSCYIGLQGMINNTSQQAQLLICSDHEEVGSASASGAQGPFLKDIIRRICQFSGNELSRLVAESMLISADNAHAIHPNFPSKHDANHAPQLNKGPVIKVNANQRYATNSATAAVFRQACASAQIPVQCMVARSDMACGSTIGPITASELGVATVDVGVPQLAMHSIRELAGRDDSYYLYQSLLQFLAMQKVVI